MMVLILFFYLADIDKEEQRDSEQFTDGTVYFCDIITILKSTTQY